jgi:hypothetical protein
VDRGNSSLFVLGAPGTGKSILLRSFLQSLGSFGESYQYNLITGQWFSDYSLLVLGEYVSEESFPGTDRWSMEVQRCAAGFWQDIAQQSCTVLGEGSRIATRPFIDAARISTLVSLVFLQVHTDILQARREWRGKQNASWVKGIETRIENLQHYYQNQLPCFTWKNETDQDLTRNLNALHTMLFSSMSVHMEDLS